MTTPDDVDLQRSARNAWPQLADFLGRHPQWVFGKAKQLLPPTVLSKAEEIADQKEKLSFILDVFLSTADTDILIFREFVQSVCMECNLPMYLEIVFMSASGESLKAEQQVAPSCKQNIAGHLTRVQEEPQKDAAYSTSTLTRPERRRSLSSLPSNANCKQSKQQRLDSAERYRQLLLTMMCQRYGCGRPAGASEFKALPSAFSQAFVNLVIHQTKAYKLKGRAEKAKKPEALLDMEELSDAAMTWSDLFRKDCAGATRVILLLGKPGMGKTSLLHKICQQWAEGNLPQFQLVFFFEFRQLNLICRRVTLQELLFSFFLQPEEHPDAVFEHLLENPQPALLVFDGLDEFVEKTQEPVSPPAFSPGPHEPLSVSELFACLCHGKLLPGCTLLVTTRPKILPEALLKTDPLLAEIWGFDRGKVEEYASSFFQQPSLKEKAIVYLKGNSKLLAMCFVPALCNIVCICLEYLLLQNAESVQLPQTMSQCYLKMLLSFLCKHQRLSALSNYTDLEEQRATLAGLCELAFKGLEENKVLFDANNVPQQVKDFACPYGLLSASEGKAGTDRPRTSYNFVHFSLQEFFASLFLLTSKTIDSKVLQRKFFLRSKWTLKKEVRMPFTENRDLFLSGLSSRDCRPFLCFLADQNEVWIQERQNVIGQTLRELVSSRLTGPRVVELCHCVYEMQDLELVRDIGKKLNFRYQFRNIRLTPLDVTTLAYVINASVDSVHLDFVGCPVELDYLDVLGSCENIKNLSFKSRKYGDEFAAALCRSLPKIKCLASFQLTGGNITAMGLEDLIRTFPKCHQLAEISLQDNRLKEKELIKITEIFSTVGKLKNLDLCENRISRNTILTFTRVAATCQSVTKLHVRRNTLRISFAGDSRKDPKLKDPGIKEEEPGPKTRCLALQLQECQLDSECAKTVADILLGCCQLSELDLSGNNLGDEGCNTLMEVLPKICISGPLNLNRNQLSMKSIFCLLRLMSVCQNVVTLEASIQRQMAILTLVSKDVVEASRSGSGSSNADQLRSDGHQMDAISRKVCLTDNEIWDEDLNNLCLALRSCSDVSEIDLSNNSLGDSGVLKIVESLSDLKSLRSLRLDCNDMSLNGVFSLLRFFSDLEQMTCVKIGLGRTQKVHLIFDETISLQRHGVICEDQGTIWGHKNHLPQGRCFCFKDCPLNPKEMDQLFKILSKCPDLTEINLSGNKLDNEGLRCLVEHLPKTQLSCLIKISHNGISQDGVLYLVNAFATYQSITEVHVSLCSELQLVLITLVREDKPPKTLRLKRCDFRAEHLVQLYTCLRKCHHLHHIQLAHNGIMPSGVQDLFRSLRKHRGVLRISIEEPWVKDKSIVDLLKLAAEVQGRITEITVDKEEALFRVDQEFPHQAEKEDFEVGSWPQLHRTDAEVTVIPALKKLKLNFCRICPAGMARLAAALYHCQAIEDIDFSESELSTDGISALLNTLEEKSHLKNLNLGSLNLDNTNILKLILSISRMSQLGRLSLHNNNIGSEVCCRLADVLKNALHLEEINLSHNKIGDAGVREIAAAVPDMQKIKQINFSYNSIGSTGGQCFVEALADIGNLEILKLSGNKIGNETLEKLALVLPFLHHLKVLHLSSCGFDSEGAAHLAKGLFNCRQMEEISLSVNRIGCKGVMVLTEYLLQSSQLRKIEMKVCDISDSVSSRLAFALGCCPLLEEIILSWNKLGDETAHELARVLPQMPRLRALDLDNNSITFSGAKKLAMGLARCWGNQVIRLWHNPISEPEQRLLGEQDARLHFSFF